MILPLLFGSLAIFVLFFKLPGVPELMGVLNCKSCTTPSPYLPMLAASYFAGLLTCILCFRSWPSSLFRIAGLIWASGLALSLTYLSPMWCFICLVAHGCHVLMWVFWKPTHKQPEEMVGMKASIVLTSCFAVMALFSTLNFTFLVYGLQVKSPISSVVKSGTVVKPFELATLEDSTLTSDQLSNYSGVILNFVSANCPYCEEQIPKLDAIAKEFGNKGFRFINVSTKVIDEVHALGSNLEWVEDQGAALQPLFGIGGYPTMILIDSEGVVVQATAGISTDFEEVLKTQLTGLAR